MLVSEAGIAAQLNNSKQSKRKMPLTSLFLGGSSLAAKRAVEQAQLGVGLIPLEAVGGWACEQAGSTLWHWPQRG